MPVVVPNMAGLHTHHAFCCSHSCLCSGQCPERGTLPSFVVTRSPTRQNNPCTIFEIVVWQLHPCCAVVSTMLVVQTAQSGQTDVGAYLLRATVQSRHYGGSARPTQCAGDMCMPMLCFSAPASPPLPCRHAQLLPGNKGLHRLVEVVVVLVMWQCNGQHLQQLPK